MASNDWNELNEEVEIVAPPYPKGNNKGQQGISTNAIIELLRKLATQIQDHEKKGYKEFTQHEMPEFHGMMNP